MRGRQGQLEGSCPSTFHPPRFLERLKGIISVLSPQFRSIVRVGNKHIIDRATWLPGAQIARKKLAMNVQLPTARSMEMGRPPRSLHLQSADVLRSHVMLVASESLESAPTLQQCLLNHILTRALVQWRPASLLAVRAVRFRMCLRGGGCVHKCDRSEGVSSSTCHVLPNSPQRESYMSRFEQRIDSLEEKVRRHDDLLRNPQLATPSRDDGGQSRQNIVESSKHVRFRNEIAVDAAKLQELPSEEVQTDGMAVTFVNEEDTAFFGEQTRVKGQGL